jgi:S1-C subfamily serine protease
VNGFDALLVALLALAAIGGARLGLIRGAFAWFGLALGIVVGILFVDNVTTVFKKQSPDVRFLVALAFLLLVIVVVQTLGIALGSVVARVLPPNGPIRWLDQFGGAILGALATLVILWLLIPALASSPGWTARGVRGSWIAQQVEDAAGDQPASFEALGRMVGSAPFPEVFRELTDGGAGEPPTAGINPTVATLVSGAIVRVEGQACSLVLDGSGFAVAPETVVTNAHVVAGERTTDVYTNDGRRYDAVVVAFDPERDVAILHVAGAGLPPLAMVDAPEGTVGSVLGHPGGGPLRAAAARVDRIVSASGTDIYRTSHTDRAVLVLAAHLEPGDSGAPLVDGDGHVFGVAFAVDPGDRGTAYALAKSEIDAVLAPSFDATTPVHTGKCLVG